MNLDNWQTQLRKGLLEMVVLNMLNHEVYHGYDMVQTLKHINGLKIREGNIYPILARLQADGLVKSYSEPSTDGPERKYFELTNAGKKTLLNMNTHWEQIIQGLETIKKGEYKWRPKTGNGRK